MTFIMNNARTTLPALFGFLSLTMAACAFAACGSSDSGAGNAALPAPPQADPAIQSVTPSTIFRGRATTISIGGIATSFTSASTVTISGGKVKVAAVHAISGAGLVAQVFVPGDVADAALDVVVDGLSARGALTLADPIELGKAHFRAKQGGLVSEQVINHDLAHPLDARTTFDFGPGVAGTIDFVSGGEATLNVEVSPSAALGVRDLKITLGGAPGAAGDGGVDGGAPTDALTTFFPSALLVDPGDLAKLPPDAPLAVTVPEGVDGAYLTIPGSAGKLIDLRSLGATSDKKVGVTPLLAILDPEKGRTKPLSVLPSDELLAFGDASADPIAFAAPLDVVAAGTTHFTLFAHVMTASASAEAEPNETPAAANTATLPFVVSAALGTIDDQDCFNIVAPTGTLVLRTLPAAGGYGVDTIIEILDDAGAVLAANEDEDTASNDYFSSVRVTGAARTVHACVRVGGSAPLIGAYRLVGMAR